MLCKGCVLIFLIVLFFNANVLYKYDHDCS